MDFILAFAGLALAHLLAMASPGPAFILVLQESAARDRRAGLVLSFGVALGSLLWVLLVLLGVGLLLQQASWLYGTLRVLGGLYLIYLAYRLWRSAPQPLDLESLGPAPRGSGGRSIVRGLLTNLLNPKAAVFFGSIFLAFLPPELATWQLAAVALYIFLVECLWYALVASLFSLQRVRLGYAAAKTWIDRLAGGCLAVLGAKLAFSER